MNRVLHLIIPFILLSAIAGCGSGKGNSAKDTSGSDHTLKISPEVGTVLKLLSGETTQASQAENQSQNITTSKRLLYKSSATSLFDPIPKDGPCQYAGWEKYTPENLNPNTVRQTNIYTKCKKDHPIASDIIEYLDGQEVIDQTDPDYQGTDPLHYPYFSAKERILRLENFTGEEYDSFGVLLTRTFYPTYYSRNIWDFDKMNLSMDIQWISGSGHSVSTRGTPNDPSDDYIYEAAYDNYYSEGFSSDYIFDKNGTGYARINRGTASGYKKVTWEDRKAGKMYSFGALYEDFGGESYLTDDIDARYYSVDGVITPDSCSGKKFVIKTTLSLYKPFSSPCPLDGEIVVTIGEREVTLRFLENMTVEVDADSDGVVDETVSCQIVLDSDFCM